MQRMSSVNWRIVRKLVHAERVLSLNVASGAYSVLLESMKKAYIYSNRRVKVKIPSCIHKGLSCDCNSIYVLAITKLI